MAVLVLFAAAREAAGAGRVTIDGANVGEVLDGARTRFGEDFATVLATSRVWVNGAAAAVDDAVGEGDEVAILPPVSGGCGR